MCCCCCCLNFESLFLAWKCLISCANELMKWILWVGAFSTKKKLRFRWAFDSSWDRILFDLEWGMEKRRRKMRKKKKLFVEEGGDDRAKNNGISSEGWGGEAEKKKRNYLPTFSFHFFWFSFLSDNWSHFYWINLLKFYYKITKKSLKKFAKN